MPPSPNAVSGDSNLRTTGVPVVLLRRDPARTAQRAVPTRNRVKRRPVQNHDVVRGCAAVGLCYVWPALRLGLQQLIKFAKTPFGVAAVLLVLLLDLLAASPSLHERFHADAG